MHQFPEDLTFAEVRAAVDGNNNFVVKVDEEGGYGIVNYLAISEETFPEVACRRTALLRECRGITFDLESGAVVARKFHKFFNLGERPETDPANVDFSMPHVILEKMDGSMITPYLNRDGDVEWHSKMGRTFLTPMVAEFVANHPQYEEFADMCFELNVTPIFEFCSRKQRIVIDYPEDRLVLLAVRNNITGEYMPYDMMLETANDRGIDVVRALPGTVENLRVFMEEVRDLTGQEGYVICFDNGLRLKVKGEEYVRAHRAKDSLTHEKNVLFLIATDAIDDVIALLPDGDKDRVRAYAEEVSGWMMSWAKVLGEIVENTKDMDQKTFAIEIANTRPAPLNGLLFKIRKGDDPFDAVRNCVKNACGSQSNVDAIRILITAKWNYGGSAE